MSSFSAKKRNRNALSLMAAIIRPTNFAFVYSPHHHQQHKSENKSTLSVWQCAKSDEDDGLSLLDQKEEEEENPTRGKHRVQHGFCPPPFIIQIRSLCSRGLWYKGNVQSTEG